MEMAVVGYRARVAVQRRDSCCCIASDSLFVQTSDSTSAGKVSGDSTVDTKPFQCRGLTQDRNGDK